MTNYNDEPHETDLGTRLNAPSMESEKEIYKDGFYDGYEAGLKASLGFIDITTNMLKILITTQEDHKKIPK